MPSEIRLSFKQGSSEISVNTVNWINKFANNALKDKSVLIEVRMAVDYIGNLQTKRFSLIKGILKSKGISNNQIIPIFSSRPSNSIVLRTIQNKTNNFAKTLTKKKYIDW